MAAHRKFVSQTRRLAAFGLLASIGLLGSNIAVTFAATPLAITPEPPPPGNSTPSTKLPVEDQTAAEFAEALGIPLEDAGGNLGQVESAYAAIISAMTSDGFTINPPSWDHQSREIKIYVVRAMPSEQQQNRYHTIGGSSGLKVKISRVERTQAESEGLQARIDSDRPALARAGIQIGVTGILDGGDTVRVDLHDGTQAKADYLTETYGSLGLKINTGSVPQPADASRSNDAAPWYFGDRIYMPTFGSSCTSGFYVTKPGYGKYMLTSGHCLKTTGIDVEYWWDTSQYFGYSSQVDWVDNAPADSALVTGSYLPYVWNMESTILAQRTASSGDIIGQDACFNGSFTFQVCRSYVTTTNVTLPTAVGQTTGLVEVTAGSGVTICQSGDSGGPVYDASPGNGIRARGIIKACTPSPYQNVGYFLPWYRLAPRLGGLTINTP